jgi:hypothetical protein
VLTNPPGATGSSPGSDAALKDLEHRIEKSPRVLRVAVRQQLHRPFEVGEQHGDLFALAFQALLEVRILSARCLGVYDSGAT